MTGSAKRCMLWAVEDRFLGSSFGRRPPPAAGLVTTCKWAGAFVFSGERTACAGGSQWVTVAHMEHTTVAALLVLVSALFAFVWRRSDRAHRNLDDLRVHAEGRAVTAESALRYSLLSASFGHLCEIAHRMSTDKGWWDGESLISGGKVDTRLFLSKLSLVHSEVSEAVEHLRKSDDPGLLAPWHHESGKPDGVAIELADVVIRCMDLSVAAGLDLGAAVAEKMSYNALRPRRHGGKTA